MGGRLSSALAESKGQPDRTEVEQTTVNRNPEAEVREQGEAQLAIPCSKYQTVQRETSAARLKSYESSNAVIDRLSQSIREQSRSLEQQSSDTQQQSRNLEQTFQDMHRGQVSLGLAVQRMCAKVDSVTGYPWNEQGEKDVTAAVSAALLYRGFIEFDEIPDVFRRLVDQQGNILVEWDGMVACEIADVRLLVLVEAKSYLVPAHLEDIELAARIKVTRNLLDAIPESEEPLEGHRQYKRLCRYLQEEGFLGRSLVLAVGSPSMPSNLADDLLASHCIVARFQDGEYTVTGIDEALRHAE